MDGALHKMDDEYRQRSLNLLFSMDEDSGPDKKKKKINKKKCIFISSTAVGMLTVLVLILMLFGPLKLEKDDNSSTLYDKNKMDDKESSTKVDSDVPATKKQPVVTATLPSDQSETPSTSTQDLTDLITNGTSTPSAMFEQTSQPPLRTTTHRISTTATQAPPCTTANDGRTTGCLTSLLVDCHQISGCQTTAPNRYGYGSTPDRIYQTFGNFKMLLQNFECHSRSKEFLCAIIHPPCRTRIDSNVIELNYVFDIVNFVQQKTPIPCKSLCNQIGDECLKNLPESHRGGFYDLCNRMPESASEAMCFGGNLSNADADCQPNPCLNGGLCFIQRDQQYCQCTTGFYGTFCQNGNVTSYNISNDQCVRLPEECRSVLPYNNTRGINLNGTNMAYIASWDTIATVARDSSTKKTLCAFAYPQCPSDGTLIYKACQKSCMKVKNEIEFLLAAISYPTLECDKALDDNSLPTGTECI
ncbi:uncharacterized protein [Apostichopus japonicus]|uniref:uncharacterized protein isoform X2 n=1 Tax=Stichopus japonicus TaxID=307972 RepID=UPI003AB35BF2